MVGGGKIDKVLVDSFTIGYGILCAGTEGGECSRTIGGAQGVGEGLSLGDTGGKTAGKGISRAHGVDRQHLLEGATVGGEYGPYRQSERKPMYREYADQLIASGNAYYAFDTPEELDAIRNQHEEEKKTFTYNYATRENLNNSLALSAEEVQNGLNRLGFTFKKRETY